MTWKYAPSQSSRNRSRGYPQTQTRAESSAGKHLRTPYACGPALNAHQVHGRPGARIIRMHTSQRALKQPWHGCRFLILCVQTRSKRLIKIPRRHSRFTRTQACLRSVDARKHDCLQNTLNHRRHHLTHATSKARNVSSAWNAGAYSTYNARMCTLMSQGFAENGAVVARPSTPVAA